MLLDDTIENVDRRGLIGLQGILLNTVNYYQEVYQFQFPSVAMIFGENWDYLARVVQFISPDEYLNLPPRIKSINYLSSNKRLPLKQLIETYNTYFEGIECVALLPIGLRRKEETKQIGYVLGSGEDFYLLNYGCQLFKVFTNIPQQLIVNPRSIDPKLSRTH